ncbi:hypothetical protein [Streptomyces sp. NBC_00829]|uniref:hypothetical protein n=1 Tax=Streptomyces sp. NBC_00829 TaxID=2903679 RepID=UPI003864A2C1|nr:hypothetical protein OG293_21625 [Streptomyces sp. NBC_00829]
MRRSAAGAMTVVRDTLPRRAGRPARCLADCLREHRGSYQSFADCLREHRGSYRHLLP